METTDGTAESAMRFEAMAVRIMVIAEAMRATPVASIEKRGPVDRKWRVKGPAKRAVENSAARNEGIAAKPGIPIPAWSKPARPSVYVNTSLIPTRFG